MIEPAAVRPGRERQLVRAVERERSGRGGAADVEIEGRRDEEHRAGSVGETVEVHGRCGHRRRSRDGSDASRRSARRGRRRSRPPRRRRRRALRSRSPARRDAAVRAPRRRRTSGSRRARPASSLRRSVHRAGARDDGFATRERGRSPPSWSSSWSAFGLVGEAESLPEHAPTTTAHTSATASARKEGSGTHQPTRVPGRRRRYLGTG